MLQRYNIQQNQHSVLLHQSREGVWSSNFWKLRDISCFGILRGSIFRIDLVIRSKVGQNPFFERKLDWTQKPQNCSKSISRELLVLRSWLTSQNNRKTWFAIGVLRYVHPSENRRCLKNTSFFFWGLTKMKLYDFL